MKFQMKLLIQISLPHLEEGKEEFLHSAPSELSEWLEFPINCAKEHYVGIIGEKFVLSANPINKGIQFT